jgi:hypothetical protein
VLGIERAHEILVADGLRRLRLTGLLGTRHTLNTAEPAARFTAFSCRPSGPGRRITLAPHRHGRRARPGVAGRPHSGTGAVVLRNAAGLEITTVLGVAVVLGIPVFWEAVPGIASPRIASPGITGPGITGPGIIGLGIIGLGVTRLRATRLVVTGLTVTGLTVTRLRVTRLRGTGGGVTGLGVGSGRRPVADLGTGSW